MGAGAEVEKFLGPPGSPHPRHILLPYVQRGAQGLFTGPWVWGGQWCSRPRAVRAPCCLPISLQTAVPFIPFPTCLLLSPTPAPQHPSPPTADHPLSLSLPRSPPSALGMWWGGEISSHRCAAGRNCCSRRLPRAPTGARVGAFPEGPLWRPRHPCEQPLPGPSSLLPPCPCVTLCPFSCFSLCASRCLCLSPSLLSHHGN